MIQKTIQRNDTFFLIACTFVLLSIIIEALSVSHHISYFFNTIALIFFLKLVNLKNIYFLNNYIKSIYVILFLYNCWLIFRLLSNNKGYSIESYLFHPYMLQSILIFCLLLVDGSLIFTLYKRLSKILFISIILMIFSIKAGIAVLSVYIYLYMIFINYTLKKKIKSCLILMYIITFVYVQSIIFDNRFILMFLILFGLGIIVVRYFPTLKKMLLFLYIVFPFVFVILLYGYNFSLLNVSNYISASNNSILMTDTRTFLFYDVKETLESNNSLLFGEGLNGKILTTLNSEVDQSIDRLGKRRFVECNFLDLARRGGIIYVMLYAFLMIISSCNLIQAKSLTLQYISFFIATSFFCSLIGVTHSMSYETILLFLLISLSFDKGITSKTEVEIFQQLSS